MLLSEEVETLQRVMGRAAGRICLGNAAWGTKGVVQEQ